MSANPLAGLAETVGAWAKAFAGWTPMEPAKTYTPNRAQRRHMRVKTAPTTTQRGNMRRRAQAAGYAAGKAGLDHKDQGVCPYTNRVLIDAWSAGYVDGRRKRKGNA